jgi:hypothetical protein
MWPSAGELIQMQYDQEEYLPDTCTILRGTAANDALGEAVEFWGTVGTAVPCRVRSSGPSPLRADLRPVADQVEVISKLFLTVAHDVDVQTGDRIVHNAVTYDVVQSYEKESWKTAVRAEIQGLV